MIIGKVMHYGWHHVIAALSSAWGCYECWGFTLQLMHMQDSSYQELATFLDAVESHGSGVSCSGKQQTASEEARLLKKALMRLRQ